MERELPNKMQALHDTILMFTPTFLGHLNRDRGPTQTSAQRVHFWAIFCASNSAIFCLEKKRTLKAKLKKCPGFFPMSLCLNETRLR